MLPLIETKPSQAISLLLNQAIKATPKEPKTVGSNLNMAQQINQRLQVGDIPTASALSNITTILLEGLPSQKNS